MPVEPNCQEKRLLRDIPFPICDIRAAMGRDRIKKSEPMVDTMTMSYSYKPVFMLAFLDNMNDAGEARLEDVARSFAAFYEDRLAHGLPAEKKNCIFTKGGYSQKDVERLILSMPFKRYEDMHIMHHSKHLGTLQFYKALVRQLTDEDYAAIRESCHAAIARYFGTAKA